MQFSEFKYGNYRIIYPENYYPAPPYRTLPYLTAVEVFVLDIYRSSLLRDNDLVIDLGAGTGDFSILASKKVGEGGMVIAIEPDPDVYRILELNIEKNSCKNVTALNIGVGGKPEEKDITFWGKTFGIKVKRLEKILEELHIENKIDFLKMDIEGSEVDVLNASTDIIKRANVISMELHGTEAKRKTDEILLSNGFSFKPITMTYVYKRIFVNLFLHPHLLCKVYLDYIQERPEIIRRAITGFDMTKQHLLVGSYIKNL